MSNWRSRVEFISKERGLCYWKVRHLNTHVNSLCGRVGVKVTLSYSDTYLVAYVGVCWNKVGIK